MDGTRNQKTERWHGTSGGYTNHKCRCADCRKAWAESCRRSKARRLARATPEHVHGTANGYGSYGCRCEECTRAYTLANRKQKGLDLSRPYKRHRTPSERARDDLAKLARRLERAEAGRIRREEKAARKAAKVTFEDRYVVNETSGCWEWQGPLIAGYGSYGGMGAHRWSYLNSGKTIPNGHQVDHRCHKPDECHPRTSAECPHRSCVNPEHLEAVTPIENFTRSGSPSALPLREGICSNGHVFGGDNVRIRKDGHRECVQCNRDRCSRYRARKAQHAA